MKHATRRLLRSLSITTVMSLAMVSMSSPSHADAIDNIGSCTDVTVVGARGTNEGQTHGSVPGYEDTSGGFGDAPALAAETLMKKMQDADPSITFAFRAVWYPAAEPNKVVAPLGTAALWSDYVGSVDKGVTDLISQAHTAVTDCPSTTLVLIGFSQGAQVVHKATALLTNKVLDRLAYVWLIADPSLRHLASPGPALAGTFDQDGDDTYQPDLIGGTRAIGLYGPLPSILTEEFRWELRGKVIEVCHTYDSICTFGYSDTEPHLVSADEATGMYVDMLGLTTVHGTAYKNPAIHVKPTDLAVPGITQMVQAGRAIRSGDAHSTFPLAVSACQAYAAQASPDLYFSSLFQSYMQNANTDCNLGPAGAVVDGGTGWLAQGLGVCESTTSLTLGASGGATGNNVPSNCQSILSQWADELNGGITPVIELPVYNKVTGTGAGASYQIIGYSKFAVRGWKFDGSSSLPGTFRNTSSYQGSSASCERTCRGIIGFFLR
jgi:hypothetical protein